MINIFVMTLALLVFFALFVSVRSLVPWNICALCAAVSTTWIGLLVLWQRGFLVDPIAVGILMGSSIVGLLYFLGSTLPERFGLFKFPFFLTLFIAVYLLLGTSTQVLNTFLVLIGVWLAAGSVYAGRDTQGVRQAAQKIITCCKNW